MSSSQLFAGKSPTYMATSGTPAWGSRSISAVRSVTRTTALPPGAGEALCLVLRSAGCTLQLHSGFPRKAKQRHQLQAWGRGREDWRFTPATCCSSGYFWAFQYGLQTWELGLSVRAPSSERRGFILTNLGAQPGACLQSGLASLRLGHAPDEQLLFRVAGTGMVLQDTHQAARGTKVTCHPLR